MTQGVSVESDLVDPEAVGYRLQVGTVMLGECQLLSVIDLSPTTHCS